MPLPIDESTVALQIDCNTVHIKPSAMSCEDALVCAFPNREAIASIGNPGIGFALMSLISTLIFEMSPSFAKFTT